MSYIVPKIVFNIAFLIFYGKIVKRFAIVISCVSNDIPIKAKTGLLQIGLGGSVSVKIILFSGVHGVGKGFFLDKVKKNIQQYNVLSASSLIEKYQPSTDAGYKKVRSVSNNQDVLIKAIKEAKNSGINEVILDGHMCIFNVKGEVERVPEYFFRKTQVAGIILLQDNARTICDRIYQRDATQISIGDIEWMQNEERKYAGELEEKYQIKYVVISHDCTGRQFEEILRKIGGESFE